MPHQFSNPFQVMLAGHCGFRNNQHTVRTCNRGDDRTTDTRRTIYNDIGQTLFFGELSCLTLTRLTSFPEFSSAIPSLAWTMGP